MASHDHLLKFGFEDAQFDEVMRQISSEIGTKLYQRDDIETGLCESIDGRLLTKFDVYIEGQSLINFDDHGTPWRKLYGEYNWQTVPHPTHIR